MGNTGMEASPPPSLPKSLEPSEAYAGASTDFFGLPSNPRCVYRTGPEWLQPDDAQPIIRETRPICNHPMKLVWPSLGVQIFEALDELGVLWTSIDPVRFAEKGGEPGPLHLWIGVIPGSLSVEAVKVAAARCQNVLAEADFPDVEIAFRESVYSRSAAGGGGAGRGRR
ncbi:hypothetical protein DFH06DRAFT_428730 [Mycena polygramma]|nr:hypothetical protein DFH06DRAFT_428730 [Mycena polygramma]